MAFDWVEYLVVSQFLQREAGNNITHEAASRSAVSRVYYAAFCLARNYARDKQGFSPTNKPKDHGLVKEHFKTQGEVKVARNLDKLRQWRNDCDYEDTVAGLFNYLTFAISKAQEVFSILK